MKLSKYLRHLLIFTEDTELSDLEKAKDPNTNPEILKNLAKHLDPNIRKAVALNPNTPAKQIFDLGGQGHPIDDNPALPLLHLEDPEFLKKVHPQDLRKIAKNDNPNLHKIIYNSIDPSDTKPSTSLLKSLLLRYSLNPDVHKQAIINNDEMIGFLALNPHVGHDTIRFLYKKFKDKPNQDLSGSVIFNLKRHPNLPEDLK